MNINTKELRAFAKHYQADTRHMIEDAADEIDAYRDELNRLLGVVGSQEDFDIIKGVLGEGKE